MKREMEAVFFDVDGTLVSFETHTMTPTLVEALWALRRKGIRTFLCTGRSPDMLPPLYALFPFDGWAAFNGQLAKVGGKTVRRVPIRKERVRELVEAVRIMEIPCIFLEEEDTYCNWPDPISTNFMLDLELPVPPAKGLDRALEGDLFQSITFVKGEEERRLLELAPRLTLTRWHPDFVDVIPSGGGKDVGTRAILDALGLDPARTMAFGDGGNDVPMFRQVGLSVAMGGSEDDVKAQADWVTGPVEEDGVVTALRHFGVL